MNTGATPRRRFGWKSHARRAARLPPPRTPLWVRRLWHGAPAEQLARQLEDAGAPRQLLALPLLDAAHDLVRRRSVDRDAFGAEARAAIRRVVRALVGGMDPAQRVATYALVDALGSRVAFPNITFEYVLSPAYGPELTVARLLHQGFLVAAGERLALPPRSVADTMRWLLTSSPPFGGGFAANYFDLRARHRWCIEPWHDGVPDAVQVALDRAEELLGPAAILGDRTTPRTGMLAVLGARRAGVDPALATLLYDAGFEHGPWGAIWCRSLAPEWARGRALRADARRDEAAG